LYAATLLSALLVAGFFAQPSMSLPLQPDCAPEVDQDWSAYQSPNATAFLDTGLFASSAILFQAFNWVSISNRNAQFATIASQAATIKGAGFTHAWLPPPSQSVDKEGYLPQQWYVLEGDANQRSAISALRSNGIVAVADVVVNHRTAPTIDSCTGDYTVFRNPDMGNWAVVRNDGKCEGGVFCKDGCGCNTYDTGDNICYAPDLNHVDTRVRDNVKAYLSFLKQAGYSGWRWDVAKGFSAGYFGEYNSASAPSFSVGEAFDGNLNVVLNWISGSGSPAFDFPLRYVLRDTIRSNNFGALKGAGVMSQRPDYAVTFIDNHDTERDDRFGSATQITMGYAVILTHPGIPKVFWSDWQISSVNTAIRSLISIRKARGINSSSRLFVAQASSGVYAAYVGPSGSTNEIAVKIGTGSWAPPDASFKVATSGQNYAVWTR